VLTTSCSNHSFAPADDLCSQCGFPFCSACLARGDVSLRCQGCRKRKVTRPSMVVPSATSAVSPRTSAPVPAQPSDAIVVPWQSSLTPHAAGSPVADHIARDWRTFVSLGIALCGAIFLASSAAASVGRQGVTFRAVLLGAYIAWALFWGFPVFWRWWRRSSFGLGSLHQAWRAGFVRIALALAFLITGGYFFSVLGGGIYQFFRYRRALRSQLGGRP
jgi:hypothetical protein